MTSTGASISRARVVIFDMGGVLVELGPTTELLVGDRLPPEQFWERWLTSEVVRDFESGHCSVEEFGQRLVDELGLSITADDFIARFSGWPKGLFDGAEELVASINDGIEIAVLSNTNALHWENQVDHERVKALFDRLFLSFELGLAKPDAVIFEEVLAQLDVPASEVVFLDDNQANVDGACSVGIDAALTKGIDQARSALAERGLLTDPSSNRA